jgi:uncharacterized membrane protein
MAGVVERNIRALLAHRQDEERKMGLQDRLSDAITRFTGSMTFVYAHVVFFGLWIAINLGWVPGVPRFDETFVAGDGRVGRSDFPVDFRSDQSE